MSIEAARGFLSRMKGDAGLVEKIAGCSDLAGRMELARSAGFDFTAEEIRTVGKELSDGDLDMVGGGIYRSYWEIF